MMRRRFFKYTLLLICAVLIGGVLVFSLSTHKDAEEEVILPLHDEEPETVDIPFKRYEVIGSSVEGRALEAYTFGNGAHVLLFVGGIHGGYEWNSVLLSYQLIDYLTENPDLVPDTVTVAIVPSANPDGVFEVVGAEGRFASEDVSDDVPFGTGRFNARGVDLNRNFDCKWEPTSTWRGNVVSAGTHAFSEPEAQALRDFILTTNPKAVVFWHSQASAVYASECEEGILPTTLTLMDAYADASGYRAVESFDAYPVTGDAEGWLASIGIPAVTVELTTHTDVEWEENRAGVETLLMLDLENW